MALATVVGGLGCGDLTPSSSHAPDHLVKSGGDQQDWFFNNPLPLPYSVTVVDASDRPVAGVSVDWQPATGFDGSFSSNPSTTDATGVATTIHTIGTGTIYAVNASVSGLAHVTFVAHASQPGTAVGVTVSDFLFTPRDTAVQVGGTVTWTWSAGATQHNVTYTNGPAQLPDSSGTRTAPASFSTTFTTPGRYSYHCTVHAGMDGTVTVVN
jgi:plastocyanin